ncbi:Hypothetical predicted protein [Olea europaea subsp. europaea]|uniref:Uncharacterized protein n=1 Tax=Olea europaea subsp. europaea TaxID=158383 RepID=A0A8S0T7T8_OLEEU|nr:Hypothetical predicted protein [Olea europaea subsp. europaea]
MAMAIWLLCWRKIHVVKKVVVGMVSDGLVMMMVVNDHRSGCVCEKIFFAISVQIK